MQAQAERIELAKQLGFNLGSGAKGDATGGAEEEGNVNMHIYLITINLITITIVI